MKSTFPRITLPGVDPEKAEIVRLAVEAEREHEQHLRTQQRLLAQAMLRLGKPVFRSARGEGKRKAQTAARKAARR